MKEDRTIADLASAPLALVGIVNPVPDEIQQGLIKAAYATAEKLKADYEAIPDDAPDAMRKAALQELKKAVKKADDAAKDFPKTVADELITRIGLKALATQLECRSGRSFDPLCVRGRLSELSKRIEADLDAMKTPDPVHTYVVKVECTDAELKKVMKPFEGRMIFAAPQSDKAMNQIDKWIRENL